MSKNSYWKICRNEISFVIHQHYSLSRSKSFRAKVQKRTRINESFTHKFPVWNVPKVILMVDANARSESNEKPKVFLCSITSSAWYYTHTRYLWWCVMLMFGNNGKCEYCNEMRRHELREKIYRSRFGHKMIVIRKMSTHLFICR